MSEKIAERPIIFSPPMVRVILEGRKTMTRRVVKPQPFLRESWWRFSTKKPIGDPPATNFLLSSPEFVTEILNLIPCPYGKPGDRLWVRETWQYYDWTEEGEPWIKYGADEGVSLTKNIPEEWWDKVWDVWSDLSVSENYKIDGRAADRKWRPSIYMPRWASRITLEIVDVRVERLQEITEEDALAEGVNKLSPCPQRAFLTLWDSINGKKPGRSWADNPWVWAISFRRIQ